MRRIDAQILKIVYLKLRSESNQHILLLAYIILIILVITNAVTKSSKKKTSKNDIRIRFIALINIIFFPVARGNDKV